MLVTWDEKKNTINKQKHHMSLDAASEVFTDENRIELYDVEHSVDEDRYIVLGKVGEIIFVVYTIRKNIYRLISARKATKMERRLYYDTLRNH